MTETATTTFKITSWDEQPLREDEGGPKRSHAQVRQDYTGELEGAATLDYLLQYRADGTALFVGFERFEGALRGRRGGFTLQHVGEFRDGRASTRWSVVTGSGTGELEGLAGEGSYSVGEGREHEIQLALVP